jgi:hypothetical protein
VIRISVARSRKRGAAQRGSHRRPAVEGLERVASAGMAGLRSTFAGIACGDEGMHQSDGFFRFPTAVDRHFSGDGGTVSNRWRCAGRKPVEPIGQ